MTDLALSSFSGNADEKGKFALNFISQIMKLPGATVDRESFLRSQLRSHCREEQVQSAIKTSPAHACIDSKRIDKIANSVINSHVVKAGMSSFAAGLPGGFMLLITVPADTVQFTLHAVVLAQKLAYLYGWPDLQDADMDDETEIRVAMLLGTMLGMSQANKLLKSLSLNFAQQVGIRVQRQALTKTIYYPTLKKSLRWIGVSLNKQLFAKGLAKAVPVAGGFAAAGMTTLTLRAGGRRLKRHLKELEYAKKPPPDEPTAVVIEA